MKTHQVKWQGKTVTLNLRSKPDDIASMAMEAFVERSLEVYVDTMTDDPILLSQYNKGEYCLLVKEVDSGYHIEYFTQQDYNAGMMPEELNKEIKSRMESVPVRMQEQRAFPVSERKMPWSDSNGTKDA